jgi:conjugative transfer pilus assembly protein TraH
MKLKTLILGLAIGSASLSVNSAQSMGDVFDQINAYGNVGGATGIQGQTMNHYTGGSAFVRVPKSTYNLASLTPPSVSAGCGGIDMYMGGFSFINKEQFISMAKNIGSNALGYGFKLAIQNLCPTCDNVMQALQSTTQAINRMNIDSCEAAKGIVNATTAQLNLKGREQSALNFGTFKNIFSDMSEGWGNIKGNASKTEQVNNTVQNADPNVKDHTPANGNLTWKALNKAGLTTTEKQMIMGMIGTVSIVKDANNNQIVKPYARRIGNISEFIGKPGETSVKLPVWACANGTGVDECTSLTAAEQNSTSFYWMVKLKLDGLINAISTRQNIANSQELIEFVNVTDIPVYKLIAVNTRYGNGDAARFALNNYYELLAAKYAQAYVEMVARDVNAALDNYIAGTQSELYSQELKRLKEEIIQLRTEINTSIATTYQRTNVAYNIAMEVNQMERTLHSNMSQSLRQSIAFANTLK